MNPCLTFRRSVSTFISQGTTDKRTQKLGSLMDCVKTVLFVESGARVRGEEGKSRARRGEEGEARVRGWEEGVWSTERFSHKR